MRPPVMTSRQFFTVSLALPCITPFVAISALLAQEGTGLAAPEPVVQALWTVSGGLLAVPLYAPAAMVIAVLLRRRPIGRTHLFASLAFPVAMALVTLGAASIDSPSEPPMSSSDALRVAGHWGLAMLVVAALLVTLTHVVHGVLRRAGFVVPEGAA